MSDQLESAVEDALVEGVEALGGLCLKLRMPWFTGIPDRLVLLPGARVHFVELKRPKGGRLSKRQIVVQMQLLHLGLSVLNLNTVDAVERFLERPC
jgi:hypothetical protein